MPLVGDGVEAAADGGRQGGRTPEPGKGHYARATTRSPNADTGGLKIGLDSASTFRLPCPPITTLLLAENPRGGPTGGGTTGGGVEKRFFFPTASPP